LAKDEAMIAMGKAGYAKDLFAKARQHYGEATAAGGLIPAQKTLDAIEDWLPRLVHGSEKVRKSQDVVKGWLNSTKDTILQHMKHLKPTDLDAETQAYDLLIKRAESKGGVGLGAYHAIRGALADDLHIAADKALQALQAGKFNQLTNQAQIAQTKGGDAANALVQARDAYMKGRSLESIEKYFKDAVSSIGGEGGALKFDAKAVLNKLAKDKWFPRAFAPEEQQKIIGTLQVLNTIGKVVPKQGSNAIRGRLLREVGLASLAGGAAHYAVSNPFATGTAFAVGLTGPPLYETARNFATALQMETGQELLKRLAFYGMGRFTPEASHLLGSYVSTVLRPTNPQAMPQPQGQQP
jgi:hypothetical protein